MIAIEILLQFLLGTLVLWFCSKTVETSRDTFATAAIYNAIMTGLMIALLGLTVLGLPGLILFIFLLVIVFISFWLLMRLYGISFLSSLWLVIAVWAVSWLVEFLMGLTG